MDRLIYTNAIGQIVEFSPTSKYKLQSITDLGGTDVINRSISSPFQDGSSPVGDSYFNSRLLRVEIATFSNDLVSDLRGLDTILNPKIGNGELKFEQNGDARVLSPVKIRQMPTRLRGKDHGKTFQISSLIFEAFNPFYTDSLFNETNVTTGANVFSFPVNITDTFIFDYLNEEGIIAINEGDVECPVTIIFDGPQTAPLQVENITTGEKIVISLSLEVDERLTITTNIEDTNVILTNLSTGEETVAFQYIDVAQTTFFQLVKGINNIKISANEAAIEEATVRFKNRYVGV